MADRITVIGWDGSPLTAAARSALSAATLVAGAAHHLALPEVPPGAERIRLGSVSLAARRIAGHRGSAVVLADGDPGFHGVVRTLRAPEYGLEVEVVPAVSSVAAAFARAGMPWDDAEVVVAHPRTLRRAVNVCRAHPKVAVLTSPGAGPAELALLLEGVHRTFVICEELGTTREQVTVLTSDKAADHTWRDPNVVIVIGGGGPRTPRRSAAGRCRPPSTAKGSARASTPDCAPPNWPGSARAPATWSGTSARAVEHWPSRRPGSAPPSSRSTPTARAVSVRTRPRTASGSSSRSSTGRHPRYWSGCRSPTWSGSVAGEWQLSPAAPTADPGASSPTRPPGTRPRRSGRRWRTAATWWNARCCNPSTWTPAPGRSASARSSSWCRAAVRKVAPDPAPGRRGVGWPTVVPQLEVRRFVRQCPEKGTVLGPVWYGGTGDARRGAAHSGPWQESLHGVERP